MIEFFFPPAPSRFRVLLVLGFVVTCYLGATALDMQAARLDYCHDQGLIWSPSTDTCIKELPHHG
jgi:hypothetical protein